MPPLPVISGSTAVRAFERAGWRRERQTGSHITLALSGRFDIIVNLDRYNEMRFLLNAVWL